MSGFNSNSAILERLQTLNSDPNFKKYGDPVLNLGAEWNYKFGVFLNNLNVTQAINLSQNASTGITLGWNYLDGVLSLLSGITMIMDNDNYRQTQTKFKGIINILSGLQLFAGSYNPGIAHLGAQLGVPALSSATAGAAPVFAIAMLADLINATIDFYNAFREVNFETWLEERLKELKFLDERIATKTKNQLQRQKILETRKNNLLNLVGARCRVYCENGQSDFDINVSNDDDVTKMLDGPNSAKDTKESRKQYIKNTFTQMLNLSTNTPQIYGQPMKFFTDSPCALDIETDKAEQAKLTAAYNEARINLILKTLSFVGMVLLAIAPFVPCPPIFIAGLVITTIVAMCYLLKNTPKLAEGCVSAGKQMHTLFKNTSAANQVPLKPLSVVALSH